MYAIILNLMFFILGLISLGIMCLMPNNTDAELTFFVFTMIFSGVWVVSAFAMTINHFVKAEEIVSRIENIKTTQNKIKLQVQKKEELTTFMNEQVLNVFPKFEEKILKALSPGSNKDLIALFQKYPELKSSKHLSELVKETTVLVNNIYREKEHLEDQKTKIRVYLANPWFLVKLKMSEEIKELIRERI